MVAGLKCIGHGSETLNIRTPIEKLKHFQVPAMCDTGDDIKQDFGIKLIDPARGANIRMIYTRAPSRPPRDGLKPRRGLISQLRSE